MGRIKRSFDHAFKVRVCESIESGARTVVQICQEYQLQRQTVERWFQLHVSGELAARAKSLSRTDELERECEKLRSKVGELTMQIDALKKADRFKHSVKKDNSWIISSKSSDPEVKLAGPLGFLDPVTTSEKKIPNKKPSKKTRIF